MNAIRQIVISDAAGNLPIQVPVELRQRPVEVIVLPVDKNDDIISPILTGSNAVANAWKIIQKAQLDEALRQSIDALQEEAQRKGLTQELLDELLEGDND